LTLAIFATMKCVVILTGRVNSTTGIFLMQAEVSI